MSEHIEKEVLKDYGERKLSAMEKAKVIRHLAECAVCLEEYRIMFPELTNYERKVLISDDEFEEFEEPFHLNFEEHLQPFVDGEIKDYDREIVESHIKICSYCAAGLRDLQEFKITLESRELDESHEKPKFWQKISEYFGSSIKPLAFALSLILAVGLGLVWWISSSSIDQDEVAVENTSTNQNTDTKIIENKNVNSENANDANDQENKKTNENSNTNQQNQELPKVSEEKPELAGLSGINRTIVSRAIEQERVEIPQYVALLSAKSKILRGTGSGNQKKQISPNNQVLRSSRPVFNWEKQADTQEYEIEIFDENFNLIRKSPKLVGNKWQTDKSLPRGKILLWKVSTDKNNNIENKQQGVFYILDSRTITEIEQVEKNRQVSELARGIVYAKAGLVKEAEKELKIYLSNNPNSKIAKKLLSQLP